ncbi:hypothetical protein PanWU01x14_213870 [Parasponia andersonii]|uniref:Uncharacterized protein n=1 Tax=Parasponia andersonii TaxID=3476 RepID=A0A2P5BSN4_PARAD|nr:hypothetical protein PanWU01x14_213870 [Parasponia andersonii]
MWKEEKKSWNWIGNSQLSKVISIQDNNIIQELIKNIYRSTEVDCSIFDIELNYIPFARVKVESTTVKNDEDVASFISEQRGGKQYRVPLHMTLIKKENVCGKQINIPELDDFSNYGEDNNAKNDGHGIEDNNNINNIGDHDDDEDDDDEYDNDEYDDDVSGGGGGGGDDGDGDDDDNIDDEDEDSVDVDDNNLDANNIDNIDSNHKKDKNNNNKNNNNEDLNVLIEPIIGDASTINPMVPSNGVYTHDDSAYISSVPNAYSSHHATENNHDSQIQAYCKITATTL